MTEFPPSTEFPQFNQQQECRYGRMLFNIHDAYIGRSLALYGEFSEGEVELFRQLVRPGNLVVEIGANIGAHTLFFARHAGPTGGVVAFEPQRIVFQTLCANLALNSITNTLCFQQAVGFEPGEILVPKLDYAQPGNFGGLSLEGSLHGERTPRVTLDDLGLTQCDLLKIDVEGMEQEVLQGGVMTIGKFKPILYVENDRAEKSAELIRYIDALGYEMYWHLPPLFNADNFLRNPENVFGNIVSLNMLCHHRSTALKLDGFERVAVPK